jgi:DNA-directed RNA polymerase specialized sigma subunit
MIPTPPLGFGDSDPKLHGYIIKQATAMTLRERSSALEWWDFYQAGLEGALQAKKRVNQFGTYNGATYAVKWIRCNMMRQSRKMQPFRGGKPESREQNRRIRHVPLTEIEWWY